jgi:aspartyl aminopeptidase
MSTQRYIDFQKECLSPFHVVDQLAQRLTEQGFQSLDLTERWDLSQGSDFFVVHPGAKALIAFRLGSAAPEKSGFRILGSHTDSPVLHLRSKPLLKSDGYTLLDTHIHGGTIHRSWFDRPLVLAGRVYKAVTHKKTKKLTIESTLVRTRLPVAIIPDVAIHLDREKNSQAGGINPELVFKALLGKATNDADTMARLGALLEVAQFDGFDLCLVPYWPHQTLGMHQEFISGPRHDDLAMVFCSLEGFLRADQKPETTAVAGFFDGEETGSSVPGGAQSYFVDDVLGRILALHPRSEKDSTMGPALAKSVFLSLDMAHGVHPNFPEKHDRQHRPLMNEGPVIKINANDRYATTGYGATFFKALCNSANVPVQEFVIRQDLSCGSTIGPIVAAKLGCETIDIGAAMLGMHSTCETMGVKDLDYVTRACQEFLKS